MFPKAVKDKIVTKIYTQLFLLSRVAKPDLEYYTDPDHSETSAPIPRQNARGQFQGYQKVQNRTGRYLINNKMFDDKVTFQRIKFIISNILARTEGI